MSAQPLSANTRLILYHKQAISALTQFVRFPSGSVLVPTPLPPLSSALEETAIDENNVRPHPAGIVREICEPLGLPTHLLKAESGFREQVETPDAMLTVYLARIDTIDPPHDLVKPLNYQLLPLTALRGRPPAEMELLRRAYVCVMES